MMEVFVLVPRKKNIILQFVGMFFLVLGVVMIVLSLLGAFILMPLAVPALAIGYFMNKRYNEYEYSYFDGDVRFAKITNKNKRKTLPGYNMEDVLVLAPIDDRSLHQYLNAEGVKIRDLTSGNPKAKVYGMVVRSEGTVLVKYEPDEAYLNAVCVKYRHKVVR